MNQKLVNPVKISVMGCYVNGPGEAAEADLGVVASGPAARIYRKGQIIDSLVPFEEVIPRMTALIQAFHDEQNVNVSA